VNLTRRVYPFAAAGLIVLAGVSTAAAETYVEKSVKGAGTHHVIITVTPGHENDVIDTLKKHGSAIKFQHPSINGLSADINGSDVADVVTHGAATVTNDWVLHSAASVKRNSGASKAADADAQSNPPEVSTLRATLGLPAGSASNLSSGVLNGSGVGIAIIDSGIDGANPDFDGRIIAWKDYVSGKKAPYDDFGHGTHIAGLIASSGTSASAYMFQGVAPRANLVVLKVLDKNGASTTSRVIAAIDYVIAHRTQLGVQIINLSLGHPISAPAQFDPLVQAIEQASKHGIIVIVAAGNEGPGNGSITSPGNAPSAITVGAADGKTTITRTDDYVISFSSRGPTWYDGFAKPDVVAPAVNLFSDAAPNSTLVNATPTAWKETLGDVSLVALSGTSMGAAVATGVVALELDANTHQNGAPLTPNAAKAILEYTAIPVAKAQSKAPTNADPEGSPVAADALAQGAGQINADGAKQLASAINTTAPIRSNWLIGSVTGSSTIGLSSYDWSDNIIWGTNLLHGTVTANNFMFSRGMMWDDNIIWGTGTVRGTTLVGSTSKAKSAADNIIWGTDITSHTNVVWGAEGDNIIWGTSATLAQFRVIGERKRSQIIWNTSPEFDNIIWGTLDADNIIWGTDDGDNIIWGTWDGDNIIWGTTADSRIALGASDSGDNIIWGTSAGQSVLKSKAKATDDNIIWGTANGKIVVMSKGDGDNIIWGTADDDNIIWRTADDNIVWGTADDNIIWGTDDALDNIIWGTSVGGR
jgi:subtilisin family serine protease